MGGGGGVRELKLPAETRYNLVVSSIYPLTLTANSLH